MLKETEIAKNKPSDSWLEDVEADLPHELVESERHGKLPQNLSNKKITLKVRDWTSGTEVKFKAELNDTLSEVFRKAAEALNKPLLPPALSQPLDVFRCKMRGGNWEEITNFEQPLWLALLRGCTRNFAVEYKLVVKINTRWGVAPSSNATPRQLLTAFGMNPDEFSLYRTDSTEPLPPDSPLELQRADKFEAQKDGRYGGDNAATTVLRGFQTIEDDVEAANEAGAYARLHNYAGQKYVELRGIEIPSPPWVKNSASILVAVPITYPSGGLDAFYLELPMSHSSGSIPNQQNIIQLDGRNWALISWHYHPNRPWNPLQDDLVSHLQHCRGYFLTRGVKQ